MAGKRDFHLRGDLQAEVMAAVWKLGEATVDDVRGQQRGRRSAYTTVQTVLNRLVERGLLTRKRRGKSFLYKARYDEPEFLARTIDERLAKASPDARRVALINLVDRLEPDEIDELARQTRRIRRARGQS
jgi:predicted transcriptional regulator